MGLNEPNSTRILSWASTKFEKISMWNSSDLMSFESLIHLLRSYLFESETLYVIVRINVLKTSLLFSQSLIDRLNNGIEKQRKLIEMIKLMYNPTSTDPLSVCYFS